MRCVTAVRRHLYLGKGAYTALKNLDEKPDDPLHARDTFLAGIAHAASVGAISESDAKQVLMQTASASPDHVAVAQELASPQMQSGGASAR